MKVEDLPIPESVKKSILESGVSILYPPQEDAIRAEALEGRNLVLASPTASGKTLVAELCALKHIIEGGGKVLYLTPLRALASEKYDDFQKYKNISKKNGRKISIAISSGDYDSSDQWLSRYDLIIVTNEKCDSLLRHKSDWIKEVSLVVTDEVHFLNDAERGPTLEVTLTRLMEINPKAQFLALSATIRNAEEIAEWLKARAITTDWRPVKLAEGVCLDDECQFNDGNSIKVNKDDQNPALNLAVLTIKQGGQVLIFAETRRKAVDYAKRAATVVSKHLSKIEKKTLSGLADKIAESGERNRLNDLLAELIRNGVAFHHAGLVTFHRKIVEDAFKEGRLKVISATPTLAAGVNLPARMVIITSYERYESGYGRFPISVLDYKQMAGRAGRPKYDKIGEAVLLSRTEEEQDYLMESYVFAKPERIWSKLAAENILRSHVLASVASGYVHTEQGLYDFFNKTFYAHEYGSEVIAPLVAKALMFLYKERMISFEGKGISATDFGRRVSELYIDPVSGVVIRDALKRRSESLTDMSFLHMVCHTPDVVPKYYPRRREIDEFGAYVGIHSEEFMIPIPDETDMIEYESFLGEIKCAHVLESWTQEVPEDEIIEKYSVEPGDLFRLVDTVNWLLYASFELSRLFGHKDLLTKISEIRERVDKGVKKELLPLVRLEGIGRARGRMLFNSGFRNIDELKQASIDKITQVPLIGLQTAKRIKEQVGGLIKAEEWERLKTKKEGKQRSLSEY
ncbi:MAG: ATP-dependent helicase [Thermoproteota archaeon]|nr:ATP-dependent helicase [Thermoproteota archaeon]